MVTKFAVDSRIATYDNGKSMVKIPLQETYTKGQIVSIIEEVGLSLDEFEHMLRFNKMLEMSVKTPPFRKKK